MSILKFDENKNPYLDFEGEEALSISASKERELLAKWGTYEDKYLDGIYDFPIEEEGEK